MPPHRGAGFRARGWVPGLGPAASEGGSPRPPRGGTRSRAAGDRLGRRRRDDQRAQPSFGWRSRAALPTRVSDSATREPHACARPGLQSMRARNALLLLYHMWLRLRAPDGDRGRGLSLLRRRRGVRPPPRGSAPACCERPAPENGATWWVARGVAPSARPGGVDISGPGRGPYLPTPTAAAWSCRLRRLRAVVLPRAALLEAGRVAGAGPPAREAARPTRRSIGVLKRAPPRSRQAGAKAVTVSAGPRALP
jgi:hypothetical protein